ncbi:MAG: hypothetical protein ABI999_16880 [Acidobacteriota bacterium]
MTWYKNLSGKSGVDSYEIREKSIVIKFRYAGRYLYNYDRPGEEYVEEMKRLAVSGLGLSTYISKNVKKKFAKKL